MTLAAGSRVGPYEIVAAIGAGGMGEVYRARDARLNRDVAIKALPDLFSLDPERVARFEREAQILASLNHPNIAGIHGLEDVGKTRFLVLELVPGESLAQRISRGPIPLDEALALARQIAEALEAAHDKGIVHRDLKPGNVMLTPEGDVKVLDFGLARAADGRESSPSLTHSPTFTSPAMTGIGVILGTAAYMAPEQAKGRIADKRSDVWAFGCVLYEMLTGASTFSGEDVSDTLAAVLRGDPDWTRLSSAAPEPIQRLVRRCLQKDRKQRIPDVSVARFEIEEWLARRDAGPAAKPPHVRTTWKTAALVVTCVVLGVAAAAVAAFVLWPRPPAPLVARFEVKPPANTRIMVMPAGAAMDTSISADGRRIAFLAATSTSGVSLAVRRLEDIESTILPGTDRAQSHSISPDGSRVVFHAGGKLHVLRIGSSRPDMVYDVSGGVLGTRWLDNDTIVFGNVARGVSRIAAAGGGAQVIVEPEPQSLHGFPEVLPGGRAVIYTVEKAGKRRIAARALPSGSPVTIAEDATFARYVASGHLVFMQNGRLVGAPFDTSRLQLSGTPTALGEETPEKLSGGAGFDVSPNGTFVSTSGTSMPYISRFIIKSPDGKVHRYVGSELEYPRYPRVSPDGKRVAATIGPGSRGQIWVFDIAGTAQPLKLTFEDHNLWPTWTPDSKTLIFTRIITSSRSVNESPRQAILAIPSDGSSLTPRPLVTLRAGGVSLPTVHGNTMLYGSNSDTGGDIYTKTLDQEGEGRAWLAEPFTEREPAFSPDGKWVAFVSNQTGTFEVWVRPFPGPGAPVRVSAAGGREPVWARDSKELYYQQDGKLMGVSISATAPEFRFGPARVLFESGFVPFGETTPRTHDVLPDGRFLMIEERPINLLNTLTVVTGWDRVLKEKLALH